MSFSKRRLDQIEHQHNVAISIALQAKVLKVCENHSDVILDGGHDPQGAYKLGQSKFTKGELKDVFDERTEMLDAIKRAIQDNNGNDECPRCAKMLED